MAPAMRARDWLGAREAGVPDALVRRVERALPDTLTNTPPSAELASAAVTVARVVVAESSMTRAQALDLLAADALITYALEAACEEPSSLGQRADDAMRAMAALGAAD
ncbi:MAG TPA: hypothetical protein VE967_19150 [Gemmatimonadaceae bacterium]|nr:hypothetical protein [Gemmatimonadaceae bacterium]